MKDEETKKEKWIRELSEEKNPYAKECPNRHLWSEGFRAGYGNAKDKVLDLLKADVDSDLQPIAPLSSERVMEIATKESIREFVSNQGISGNNISLHGCRYLIYDYITDVLYPALTEKSYYLSELTAELCSDAGQREECEDEIDLSSPDYRHDCVKCGNSFWNKTKNDVICESCKSSITINDMTRKEPDVQLSCSQQDKYDLSRTIAIQSRIIAKQEELIELKNNLLNCLDSLRIIQSALATYDGSDEYSPEHRKLSNKEDKEYFKSEKLRKSIVKLEQELKELKGIDHK